ncbi:MAG: hypothetical protein AAFY76_09415 [Cyanobacteria bacterium J06649_11]
MGSHCVAEVPSVVANGVVSLRSPFTGGAAQVRLSLREEYLPRSLGEEHLPPNFSPPTSLHEQISKRVNSYQGIGKGEGISIKN